MLEEAKKRDHRKLGKELELFVFDDDVGPGLPMFLPRGAAIAEELEKLAKETEFAAGYQRVRTPDIARESLYRKSGHLPYYAESMFPPMELVEDKDKERLEKARWLCLENYCGKVWGGALPRGEVAKILPSLPRGTTYLPNLSWLEVGLGRRSEAKRVKAFPQQL